jgi:nitrogen fixation protein NifU and related proteins
MSSSLEGLYQQVILDHAKQKHGHGLREPVDPQHPERPLRSGESRQYNPLCGDEVTLRIAVSGAVSGADGTIEDDRVVQDLSWDGEGCSISQAATSVLHDLVVGHPVTEALSIVDDYREMLRSRGQIEPDEDVLGDAVAFAGVGRHANRVKCAILGWTAFEDALLRIGVESPTDATKSTSEGEVR